MCTNFSTSQILVFHNFTKSYPQILLFLIKLSTFPQSFPQAKLFPRQFYMRVVRRASSAERYEAKHVDSHIKRAGMRACSHPIFIEKTSAPDWGGGIFLPPLSYYQGGGIFLPLGSVSKLRGRSFY